MECDLLEKQNARAKTLSGGQMRKLQLAIAFVGGSKICCIDEASSGLVYALWISSSFILLISNRTPLVVVTSGISSPKDIPAALC